MLKHEVSALRQFEKKTESNGEIKAQDEVLYTQKEFSSHTRS